jgi:hypothetical protein
MRLYLNGDITMRPKILFVLILLAGPLMVPPDVIAQDDSKILIELWQKEKGKDEPLTKDEEALFRAAAKGHAATWPPDKDKSKILRADRIAWLCTNPIAQKLVKSGLWLEGAQIEGDLSLKSQKIPFHLKFVNCTFAKGVILLEDAELLTLELEKCVTGPIFAKRLKAKNVSIRKGSGQAWLDLEYATIARNLDCNGSVFKIPGDYAPGLVVPRRKFGRSAFSIYAWGLKVGGHLRLGHGFCAKGGVYLADATIGGVLYCDGGEFIARENGAFRALDASRIKVEADVFMGNGFKTTGKVILENATIGLDLTLGGEFTGTDSVVLDCTGLNVKGSCNLVGINSTGEVIFKDAVIGKSFLWSNKCKIWGRGAALTAPGLKVSGRFAIVDCEFVGIVDLSRSTIGADFECEKVHINDYEFRANEIKVDGFFELSGFEAATLEISFATIGKNLHFGNVTLSHRDGIALSAAGLRARSVGCDHNLSTGGSVIFAHAEIAFGFSWDPHPSVKVNVLDLRGAKIGILNIVDEKKWPEKGILMAGLTYASLGGVVSRDTLVQWLRRQPTYVPQSYDQLAEVLRKQGRVEDATFVLIQKNEDPLLLAQMPVFKRGLHKLSGLIVEYGYSPSRAFVIGLGFIAFGWFFYGLAFAMGLMKMIKKNGVEQTENEADESQSKMPWVLALLPTTYLLIFYPQIRAFWYQFSKRFFYAFFHGLVYSFERFTPVIDLDMAKNWVPDEDAAAKSRIKTGMVCFAKYYLWLHIAAGWALTTLWVCGLTGLIQK